MGHEKVLFRALKKARKPTASKIHKVVDIISANKQHYKRIVKCMSKFFEKGYKTDQSRISFIYIVDAITKWEKKHDSSGNFAKEIKKHLTFWVQTAMIVEEGLDYEKIMKVINIWDQRKIFGQVYIKRLK